MESIIYYSVEGKSDRYGKETGFFVGIYSEEDKAIKSAEKAANIFGHAISQDIGASKWAPKEEIDKYNSYDMGKRKLHSALRWENAAKFQMVGINGCNSANNYNAYLEICIFKIPADVVPEVIEDFLDIDNNEEGIS